MPEPKLKIIAMGTGPFAVPSLEAILASGDEISLVVTRPETQGKSRKPVPPSPVREWALKHDLPIFDPVSINEEASIDRLRAEAADLLMVCDYGQILSDEALSVAKLGGINLHGSLLPAYRGAAPVQWSMYNGDAETGVSVIHMTPRLDGGPVIATEKTNVLDTETAGELEHRLSEMGVAATLDAINRLRSWDGIESIGTRQDKSRVSKAPRLSKADGRIDWSRSSREIDCHIRAMQPWPGAFTEMETGGKQPMRLAILRSAPSPTPRPPEAIPGQVIAEDTGFCVVAGDGCVTITQLKPAGKRAMSTNEFMRGNPFRGQTVLH